ncbi:MAG: hypothetical protein IT308_00015 [Anaerolineaceae bacterium]|nr:hypothetical protein [Anaerolineaceae bacterium]
MQIVYAAEDFLDRLQTDVRPALPAWAASFPLVLQEDDRSFYYEDEWGYGLKMPKDDPYFYSLFYHPLRQAASISDLAQHPFPDPTDPTRLAPIAAQVALAEEKGKAILLNNICGGTMEVASWLRGLDAFLMDLSAQPDMALYLLDKIVEYKLAYWERVLDLVGNRVDVVLESDDLGTQSSLLISPRMYRNLIKPRHRRILDFVRSRTAAKVFFHSCGAVKPLIPDLIEIGVDILNPIQFSAQGMDAAALKAEFGKQIVFWGGGVETQHILGGGTPQQVREDVRRQIEILAPGGGFVFATVHNIQPDAPPENLEAMREAVMEYGVY